MYGNAYQTSCSLISAHLRLRPVNFRVAPLVLPTYLLLHHTDLCSCPMQTFCSSHTSAPASYRPLLLRHADLLFFPHIRSCIMQAFAPAPCSPSCSSHISAGIYSFPPPDQTTPGETDRIFKQVSGNRFATIQLSVVFSPVMSMFSRQTVGARRHLARYSRAGMSYMPWVRYVRSRAEARLPGEHRQYRASLARERLNCYTLHSFCTSISQFLFIHQ